MSDETTQNGEVLAEDPYAEIIADEPKPITVPVRVGGKVKYFLAEASADAAKQFRNTAVRGSSMADGVISMGGHVADAEPILLSLCLFYATPDGQMPIDHKGDFDSRKLVPMSVIRSWPSRFVEPLYERIKKISKLTMEPDTVETIDKQIVRLQHRRQQLLEAKLRTGADPTIAGAAT